jgi:uncharacterized protein YmfQ (DUF2313 family)
MPPVPGPPIEDRHVRRGQEEYAHAISALLPQGIAWPRWPDSVLMKVVFGLAGIMGHADNRAADLLEREYDPRITTEMLDWWEQAWGLPDPCYTGPSTIAERQKALVMRMTMMGGQSRAFFIKMAAYIGYTITISEYRPYMAGLDSCGDNREYRADGSLGEWPAQVGHPAMRFVWTVHVKAPRLTWARASKAQVGIDPLLKIARAEDLECIIRRWRPAHTEVLFDYSGGDVVTNRYRQTNAPLEAYCDTAPGDQVCSVPPYV